MLSHNLAICMLLCAATAVHGCESASKGSECGNTGLDDSTALLQTKAKISDIAGQRKDLENGSPNACVWGPQMTGAVAGHNVAVYPGKTLSSCKTLCDLDNRCKAVELRSDGMCALGSCQIGDGSCTNGGYTNFVYIPCMRLIPEATYVVYYDFHVSGDLKYASECRSGNCLTVCNQDPKCVGLAYYSHQQWQGYLLHKLPALANGYTSLQGAARMTPKWSFFRKVQRSCSEFPLKHSGVVDFSECPSRCDWECEYTIGADWYRCREQ